MGERVPIAESPHAGVKLSLCNEGLQGLSHAVLPAFDGLLHSP